MRLLRICLVVLLSLLLPVKGAMAAGGVHCHDAASAAAAAHAHGDGARHHHAHDAAGHDDGAHAHHASVEAHDHAAHAASDHATEQTAHHAPQDGDGAEGRAQHSVLTLLCAVSCATPLPLATSALPAPVMFTMAAFPTLRVAAPRHGGVPLDRPPRSI